MLTPYTEGDTINTDRNRKERFMIGKNIKKLREALGITQKELADKLGISQSAVGNWESGLRNPRANDLQDIAKALNTSVVQIIEGKP